MDKKIYGLDVATQWNQILEIHCLNLAKDNHPEWYRWRLTNNYERAVFLKNDPVLPRESTRYLWAFRKYQFIKRSRKPSCQSISVVGFHRA